MAKIAEIFLISKRKAINSSLTHVAKSLCLQGQVLMTWCLLKAIQKSATLLIKKLLLNKEMKKCDKKRITLFICQSKMELLDF